MTTIYQIGIIDRVTAGYGTIMVKTNNRDNPVYIVPKHPEKAVEKLTRVEGQRNDQR